MEKHVIINCCVVRGNSCCAVACLLIADGAEESAQDACLRDEEWRKKPVFVSDGQRDTIPECLDERGPGTGAFLSRCHFLSGVFSNL